VWLDQIMAGTKSLEIRGGRHHKEGNIYLLETKTGRVRGRCYLHPARPLTPEEELANASALAATGYKTPMAWPLSDVTPEVPEWFISGAARQGNVIWVPRARWEACPIGTPAIKRRRIQVLEEKRGKQY
jgi:hypothetical protein